MPFTMIPAIKSKWIDRLTNGNYEQGKSYLNRNNKLCCLGVLCEIAVEEGVIDKTIEPESDGTPVVRYENDIAVLPGKVAAWAGLSPDGTVFNADVNPILFGDNGYTRASDLNDSHDFTFKQIALIIQHTL